MMRWRQWTDHMVADAVEWYYGGLVVVGGMWRYV